MLDAMCDEIRAAHRGGDALMAGPIAKLYATLGLDAREFTKGVDTAQKQDVKSFMSSFKPQAKAGLGLGVGIGAGAAAFNALTTGVGCAVDVLGDCRRGGHGGGGRDRHA